jgi:hypothetical protein
MVYSMKQKLTGAIMLVSLALALMAQKYYDGTGKEIIKVEVIEKNDSTYVKSLPKTVSLTGLTKYDLRLFKGLMIQKLNEDDLPYNSATKKVFDQIITDLNTKRDTASNLTIVDLPVEYLIRFRNYHARMYETFIEQRKSARSFIRVSSSVMKVDTALWFMTNETQIDKSILKRDIRQKI